MDQPQLIIDSSDDAVRDTVRTLGGAKVVGPKLWPSKKPDQAERNLLDCMNPNNPRELSFDEIMLIGEWGREISCHLVAGYVNFRLGYAPPVPVDPEDTKAELQRAFIDAVSRAERIGKLIAGRP